MADFDADERRRALGNLPLFAGCSPWQLRRIAHLTSTEDAVPGRVLCRQGDPGDRFFVVLEGEATVTIDRADVATMGPGCGFGEIALLTAHGRRTATVTAATPMTLLALDRDDFAVLLDVAPVVAHRILRDATIRLARDARSRRIVASP